MTRKLRVLVADDDHDVRESLLDVLASMPDVLPVGEARSAIEAIEQSRATRPDIVLLDVRMPGGGEQAAAGIREVVPTAWIVALSGHDDPAVRERMTAAGAGAYVVKGSPLADLVDAIRAGTDQEVDIRPERRAPARPSSRIRVLVADDSAAVLEALVEVLGEDPEIDLVGAARTVGEAISLAATHHPDVALLDASMPDGGGAVAAREIRLVSTETTVVALSAHLEPDVVLSMLASGATSYLVKGESTIDLLDSVRRAAHGQSVIAGEVSSGVMDELAVRLGERGRTDSHQQQVVARIKGVLDEETLEIVFQPIFRLEPMGLVGYEALSRFPTMPSRSVDMWFAEATLVGLGRELELLAVRAALEAATTLPEHLWLSVNVSPSTALDLELHDIMGGRAHRDLVLEITEHAPVDDYDALGDAIAELKHLGVRISIDDAGSGSAGLRHLLMLDPDIIKLDILLSRHLSGARASRAIGRAMIAFANELEAVVLAEGIETTDELDTLRGLGVDLGQGFLLGSPAPLPA